MDGNDRRTSTHRGGVAGDNRLSSGFSAAGINRGRGAVFARLLVGRGAERGLVTARADGQGVWFL